MADSWENKVYYGFLVALVIFIVGSTYALAPLFVVSQGGLSFGITFLIALIYGTFTVLFVEDLEIITHHHRAGVLTTVLISSILGFFSVFFGSLNIASARLPLGYALLFSAGFFIPYLVHFVYEGKHHG